MELTDFPKRVEEVEVFLNSLPKSVILSYKRHDRNNTQFDFVNSLFTITWNIPQFFGPETILVRNMETKVVLETLFYFDKHESYHATIESLYTDVCTESKRRRSISQILYETQIRP
jgi:hypothetical protein